MPHCVDQIQTKTELEEVRDEVRTLQTALQAERQHRRLLEARMAVLEEDLRHFRRLFAVIALPELTEFEARAAAAAAEVARDGGSGPGTVRGTL